MYSLTKSHNRRYYWAITKIHLKKYWGLLKIELIRLLIKLCYTIDYDTTYKIIGKRFK